IGKLGKKYIISIRMINEDGENEVMASESCACEVDKLDETIKQISYKFLSYLAGEEVSAPESVVSREEPSYKTLSLFAVQSMPNISISKKKKLGFYCHSTINHDYNLKAIKGDKVVVDNATGLMWHQSGIDGSAWWDDLVDWDDAKERIEKLNSEGYAGYHDWRLPTVEEAASLLESSKKNGRYIDPVFSKKQKCIWAGDKRGSEAAWAVRFSDGYVYWNFISKGSAYIRPVRSMK
ncbi:MAG: DUF1566 domain-containing protein, partial [Anaerolineales bacterium]|nr:DUF1566 domain-containing protein [Anaerolineales bacterium]